jgi:hypothetical protein
MESSQCRGAGYGTRQGSRSLPRRGWVSGRCELLLEAMECKMKSRFLVGVPAFVLAAAVVLCSAAQASAHRWHRVRAPYGYSHSYYPTYAYGPGFVYAPNYAALVASLAYSASYANRPYPFYRRPWY